MDLVVPIAILIAGVFALAVVDHVVGIAPGGDVIVNPVLVGINLGASGYGGAYEGLNGGALHVGQHMQAHGPVALNEPEDGWFALGAGAASAPPFQAPPPWGAARLAAFGGLPFVASYEISLVKFSVLAKLHKRFFLAMPSRMVAPMVCTTSSLKSSSSAMRAIETLRLSR